jgi:sec-independent protein translocase protein TatC
MSPLYPRENRKLDVIGHLEELRRRILFFLAVLVLMSAVSFWQGDKLMVLVRSPIKELVDTLIFISPTEAFVAYVKVSLLSGFILSFPVLAYHSWKFLAPAFPKETRGRAVLWVFFALFLFFGGVAFSYFLAIPAALKFLINFSSPIAVPMITLGKYVSFFGAFILVGGIVFEIPVAIGLLTDAGLLRSRTLREKRAYAVLVLMVFAAVVTPTQDIINMLIFAVPMIALYEIGIVISSLIEKEKGTG